MTLVALKADASRCALWQDVFRRHAPELTLLDWSQAGQAASASYLVAWEPPRGLADAMANLRAFFCLGAGIDHLPLNEFPAGVPVIRMVDPQFTHSLAEYVATAVLMLHRDMVAYRADQAAGRWQGRPVVPSHLRRVGVMGLGNMGRAALEALRPLGFALRGWSASRKEIAGVETFAGPAERRAFLADTDILVCLLPLTDETRGILDADLFAALPPGAMLVNAGRGAHLVEQDLVRSLDTGQLSAAVLDVLEREPPPFGHPLPAHPAVVVTPHVASATHSASAALRVIDGIRDHLAGRPLDNTLNSDRGY